MITLLLPPVAKMCMAQPCPTCSKSAVPSVSSHQNLTPGITLVAIQATPADSLAGKTTWRGCGQHIPQVMDSIAQDQRCTCVPKTVVNGVKYPPMQGAGKAAEDGAKIEVGYGA